MQLLPQQQNVDALRVLASEGINLLATGQFELLVERYGYALAFGRNPVDAVRMDLAKALSDMSENNLLQVEPNDLQVIIYQENESGLCGAIDCNLPTQAGRNILVSFVVTGIDTKQFFTLEDICAKLGPD